jgi:hypothetical protein
MSTTTDVLQLPALLICFAHIYLPFLKAHEQLYLSMQSWNYTARSTTSLQPTHCFTSSPSDTASTMSSISNYHLFCLVLMAVPFPFPGLMGRTAAAPASGVSDFGTSTVSSLQASMSSASFASVTASALSPGSVFPSSILPSQSQIIIVSSRNSLSPPYPTTGQILSTMTKSLLPYET